ncbi:hypothetical protein DNTS_035701 [Danionella cerebrum]|uniref:Ig-like domain-containing protein n=1 Tax=Danionella cerebrum TaxID=2873325 RepID=A0A553QIA9_9TELE|nr:hypothetical protein DNTS_035701 [Danionella translucida]
MSFGAELSFTLEPSDIIAVQEQPLMLHCQVEGIPPISTQWRRSGLLLLEDHGHLMFPNGSLLIPRFQKNKSDGSSDEGDYECIAQNFFGLVVSRKARVQAAKCNPCSSTAVSSDTERPPPCHTHPHTNVHMDSPCCAISERSGPLVDVCEDGWLLHGDQRLTRCVQTMHCWVAVHTPGLRSQWASG